GLFGGVLVLGSCGESQRRSLGGGLFSADADRLLLPGICGFALGAISGPLGSSVSNRILVRHGGRATPAVRPSCTADLVARRGCGCAGGGRCCLCAGAESGTCAASTIACLGRIVCGRVDLGCRDIVD